MTEYIEREALIDAFEYADPDVCAVYPDQYSKWGYGIESVRDVIRSVPAADVVPVIRCKDCIHYIAGYCCRDVKSRTNMVKYEPDDFCSYAVRRE